MKIPYRYSQETYGALSLLVPTAKVEFLRQSEMPDADSLVSMIKKGRYFQPHHPTEKNAMQVSHRLSHSHSHSLGFKGLPLYTGVLLFHVGCIRLV